MRAAERRVSAEGAFVGAAKAEYLPKLSVGGTAGYTTTEFDAVGKSSGSRFAVGPMVRWPFLNLGRVKANVDAARAFEAEARFSISRVSFSEERPNCSRRSFAITSFRCSISIVFDASAARCSSTRRCSASTSVGSGGYGLGTYAV